jgi:hypothetical protein
MKQPLFFLLLFIQTLSVYAQDRLDHTFIYAGVALKADKNNLWETELKYIKTQKLLSGGFKFTNFNYRAFDGGVDVISALSGIKSHVGFEYDISGYSLKPGWIPLKKLSPKGLISLGVYGVFTNTRHDFSFVFSDVVGETKETYSQKMWNYGLELDWHMGIRFLKRGNVGASILIGYKQTHIDVFGDVVKGMHAYNSYTPAQGYGSGPLYVNFMITSGFNF